MFKLSPRKLNNSVTDTKSTQGGEAKRLRKYQKRVFGVNEFLMGYPPRPSSEGSEGQKPSHEVQRSSNFMRLVKTAGRFRNQPVAVPASASSFLKGTDWRDFLRVRAGLARFKRKVKTERRRAVFKLRQPAQAVTPAVKAKITRLFKSGSAERQGW